MNDSTSTRDQRQGLRVAAAVALFACVVAALLATTLGDPVEDGASLGAGTGEAAPEAVEAPASAAPDVAERAADAPVFDLVRVERDGSAVIAGRAAPGAHVTIYAENEPLADVEADAEGNFVAIFSAGADQAPRALTLQAEGAGGARTASEEAVMLLPRAGAAPEDGAEPDSVVVAGAGSGIEAGRAATVHQTEAEAEDGVEAAPEVAATAVLRDGSVEVQPADGGAADGERRRVSLASISYSERGEVTLAGRGTSGAVLRAYVDGSLVREASVSADGRWAMELRDLAEGRYRLRIDQIGADGRVASRVETPFQRDFPAAPRPRPGVAGPGVNVTVQPGGTLWTIARTQYGSGVLYAQIFTANSELIRDPDLIYPGQVLAIPGLDQPE